VYTQPHVPYSLTSKKQTTMKKLWYVSFALCAVFLVSCKETSSQSSTIDTSAADSTSITPNENESTLSESESASSSEDWDAVIEEYDSFTDKYITILKKAQKGDMSMYAELAEVTEELESLTQKIEEAKGEMSASQAAKFTKIQAKYLKAAAQSM
jgi:hypothetical protein